jgi:hypothetical protein
MISRRRFLRILALTTTTAGGVLSGVGLVKHELAQGRAPRLALIPTQSHPPQIVARSDWNARQPNHEAENEYGFSNDDNPTGWHVYAEDLRAVYRTVAVHHSYSGMRGTTMNSMQNGHMDNRRWADIGYHFGIDRNGAIYEGRNVSVRGASVAGYNTGTLGVVVMGNFQLERPTMPQLIALQTLVNQLALDYELTHIAGHGEFNTFSDCPGLNMYAMLDWIAAGASLRRGTGGYVSSPEATPQTAKACACCATIV